MTFIGTEKKFKLDIQCNGFDMETDEWSATVRSRLGSKRFDKTNSVNDGVDWYIIVDTAELGIGTYSLVVEIDVPDADCEDGFRHEVYKQDLMTVSAV